MDIVIIDGLSFALPLFIMAIGGIYCEKSGVTMLAVEGLQGFGAFIGAFVAVAIAGNFAGDSPAPFYIAMVMAAVGGSLFALIHAMLCLKFKANQVISGVVVNILAMALTAYLTKLFNRVVFGATSDKFVLTVSSRITIPGISKIPVLGAVFTNLYPFELVIVVVAFVAWFVMYKTRFGMHLRACGDNPHAVEVAPDLKTCKAFISVLGSEESKQSTIKGLKSAEGYIRRELARTLNLRNTPEIKFVLDQSIEYGVNMSKLIDEVTKDLKDKEGPDEDGEEEES